MPPPRAEMKRSMEALIHHFKLFTEGVHMPERVYAAIESSKGEFGVYLVSRRHQQAVPLQDPLAQLRPPCRPWTSWAAATRLADMPSIIGSLDVVFGEVDR